MTKAKTKPKAKKKETVVKKAESSNIDKLKGQLKEVGLSTSEERVKGSHYDMTIRKTGRKESKYYVAKITENATKKECDQVFKDACDELQVDVNAKSSK